MQDNLLPDQVFLKSEKGQQEIASRLAGLGSRYRQILILMDGKRDVAQLATMVGRGDAHEVVAFLLKHGFIVSSREEVPASIPAVTAENSSEDLSKAKEFMIAVARSCLGLLSADLVARVQRAERLSQLSSAAGYWMTALRESKHGAQSCEQYLQQLKEVLPELGVQQLERIS